MIGLTQKEDMVSKREKINIQVISTAALSNVFQELSEIIQKNSE
jgi:hypothetical protein